MRRTAVGSALFLLVALLVSPATARPLFSEHASAHWTAQTVPSGTATITNNGYTIACAQTAAPTVAVCISDPITGLGEARFGTCVFKVADITGTSGTADVVVQNDVDGPELGTVGGTATWDDYALFPQAVQATKLTQILPFSAFQGTAATSGSAHAVKDSSVAATTPTVTSGAVTGIGFGDRLRFALRVGGTANATVTGQIACQFGE